MKYPELNSTVRKYIERVGATLGRVYGGEYISCPSCCSRRITIQEMSAEEKNKTQNFIVGLCRNCQQSFFITWPEGVFPPGDSEADPGQPIETHSGGVWVLVILGSCLIGLGIFLVIAWSFMLQYGYLP